MSVISRIGILFLFIIIRADAVSTAYNTDVDTADINRQTREALAEARYNPDLSLLLAARALKTASGCSYLKGMADASLATGNSYLAKFNTDSARAYSHKAYELYKDIGDNTGMAHASFSLAYVYSFMGDLEESEHFSILSLEHFTSAGDLHGITHSYNALSYLAHIRKDPEKALDYILKAIETARLSGDTLLLAEVTNSQGNIYKEMALFSQAIDAYFQALLLWDMKKDSSGLAIAYGNIGLVYYYQKDFGKAMEYNRKKLPITIARGDLWETGKTYNNIALIYNSRGKPDSALIYLRKFLKHNQNMHYTSGIAEACHNIGETMLTLSQVDSAFWYISRAVETAGNINDPAIVGYYVTLAQAYIALGEYRKAEKNALTAYNLGKEKQLPHIISNVSIVLSNLYNKTNRDDLAYRYLKEHQQVKDSISNIDFLREVSRMELQYEFDKKQKAAEFAQMQDRLVSENKIKQQGILLKALLVLLFLVAAISMLLIRQNRLKALYTRIDLEQKLLRTQMNPHFIFNSLCAVHDFILAGKPEKAGIFLTKIARLMRNILETSGEEFVSLEKELETLKLYLDIQQLRFENGFDYNIAVENNIDTEIISVPPMLVQPCLENSIEHGLLPAKRRGQIDISYSMKNGLVRLEIKDNGIGRQQSRMISDQKSSKHSISTLLTLKRLDHYRKQHRKKEISYQISDITESESSAGTIVVMILPCKKLFI